MRDFDPVLFSILPLFFSAVLGPFLAMVVIRYRYSPGARPLVALVLGASLWSAGYAAEIVSPSLGAKMFWAKFQYLGITTIPLAWFLFSIRYLGFPPWLLPYRRWGGLLILFPVLTLVLAWTNELHLWVWRSVEIKAVGPFQTLVFGHGIWFWIYLSFSYLLLLAGSAWLISQLLGSQRLLRWQIGFAISGVLVPWLGNLLYVTRISPVEEIDLTPFGFTVAVLLFSISLFRFQMVRVVPVALRTVFEELADGILVLDPQNCVIDLNREAKEMVALPYRKCLGMPLSQSLPVVASLFKEIDEEVHTEVVLAGQSGLRSFELQVLPLLDRSSAPIGRLVVLHDITRREQERAQLEEAYAQLENRVSERTEALSNANLQLESELAQRSLAEGRFRDIVNSSPDAILLVEPEGRIILANARAEQIFCLPKDEFANRNIAELIPERLRARHLENFNGFFSQPIQIQIEPRNDLFARRCDGSEFPAEVYLSPLKTSEGFLIACTIRDVSVRKQTEQEQVNLLREVRESHKQLRALTASLEEAQEIERRQIAAELHDRVGQNLTALNLNLTSIQNKMPAAQDALIYNRLVDSLDLVEETTRQVRSVMADLNPPLLEEYGLVPALRWYGEKFSGRTGIRVMVSGEDCKPRPPPRMEITLYRIAQEALNNVAKHAQATQVTLHCKSTGKSFRMSLEDDGVGFDPAEIRSTGEGPAWGLLTMKERAASIGGRLIVFSKPGKGTSVVVEIRKKNR